MRFVNIFLIVCGVTFSCGNKQKEAVGLRNQSSSLNQLDSTSFDCNKIKQGVKKSDSNTFTIAGVSIDLKDLKRVDPVLYEQYLSEEFRSNSNLYIYSYSDISECSVLFFEQLILDDVSKKITLVNFDANGKVSSKIILAEQVSYPDGEMNIQSFIDHQKLLQIKTTTSIGDYSKEQDRYFEETDSITSTYNIGKTGLLELISRDSAQVVR